MKKIISLFILVTASAILFAYPNTIDGSITLVNNSKETAYVNYLSAAENTDYLSDKNVLVHGYVGNDIGSGSLNHQEIAPGSQFTIHQGLDIRNKDTDKQGKGGALYAVTVSFNDSKEAHELELKFHLKTDTHSLDIAPIGSDEGYDANVLDGSLDHSAELGYKALSESSKRDFDLSSSSITRSTDFLSTYAYTVSIKDKSL